MFLEEDCFRLYHRHHLAERVRKAPLIFLGCGTMEHIVLDTEYINHFL